MSPFPICQKIPFKHFETFKKRNQVFNRPIQDCRHAMYSDHSYRNAQLDISLHFPSLLVSLAEVVAIKLKTKAVMQWWKNMSLHVRLWSPNELKSECLMNEKTLTLCRLLKENSSHHSIRKFKSTFKRKFKSSPSIHTFNNRQLKVS